MTLDPYLTSYTKSTYRGLIIKIRAEIIKLQEENIKKKRLLIDAEAMMVLDMISI